MALVLLAGVMMTACEKEEYTITVQSNNESWGTTIGSGTYNDGTSVQIMARPNDGYVFEQWDDGNTDNPRTITVTGDKTYTAIFAEAGGDDPYNPPTEGLLMHVTFGDTEWDGSLILKVIASSPDNSETSYQLTIYQDAENGGPLCAIMLKPAEGSYYASDFEYNAAAYMNDMTDNVTVNGQQYPHYLSMDDYSITVSELDLEANTISCTVDAMLLNMANEATGSPREFVPFHVELEKAYMNNYGGKSAPKIEPVKR